MPINPATNNPARARRIEAFQKELDRADSHVLCDDGKIRAKTADLAKPADRPPICRATTVLKKITDETQRQVDAATGKTRPPAPTPPARARAKTPAPPPAPAPSNRPAAAAAASTRPAPAATSTTRTVSAVSFASLADALGITKPQLGELMASGIVPREHFCTPDGAIYWEASAVPQIIETVVKHRASKGAATAATVKPVPRAASAPGRPKVKTPAAFGEMLTDLPNLCRRLAVSPEDVRRFVGMGLIPPGRPAAPGDPSLFYWPAASTAAIAKSVKRHLATSK